MDDTQIEQLLDEAVKKAEASHGPDSKELVEFLDNYVHFLEERKLRPLDAANMKARANRIRSRHQPAQLNVKGPAAVQKNSTPLKVLVRNYKGNETKATTSFQADATKMAAYGYFPTSQTWAPGRYGCGAFLFALFLCFVFGIGILVFIYMLLVKPTGTLTVTYELREAEAIEIPVMSNEKTCPRCAEQVKAAAKACRFCGHDFEPEAG